MKLFIRTIITTLLTLGLLISVTSAQAQGVLLQRHAAPKPLFPKLSLPEAKTEGQRAINLLGTRLPEVAAFYRKSPDQLRQLLLDDSSLKINRRGRLLVEEPLPSAAQAAAVPAATSTTTSIQAAVNGTLIPLEQTFLLHSRPLAKRTIYLNFQGAVVTNTAWNVSIPSINATPFDTDGLPSSFSQSELLSIQNIWQRVVEDFAPFDVDVTTEPPASDKLLRSSLVDDIFGSMVLITNSVDFPVCNCSGIALVGTFDEPSITLTPALVFYDWALSGEVERSIADIAAHETGHNLGLSHDGDNVVTYYTGQGPVAQPTGWAPIMGASYYRPLSQWSKGEYLNANNVEDDFVVMQDNGLSLRMDDHGNSAVSATELSGAAVAGLTSLGVEGVIEQASDVDVFSFQAEAGSVTFTLSTVAIGPDLDAQLELRDSAGVIIASANPIDALDAVLTATLPVRGTYFIFVKGVGKGDPLIDGYSNYGSVGQYALSGNIPTLTGGIAPTALISIAPTSGAAPLTINFSGQNSSDTDGSIVSYLWDFGDNSTATGVDATHTYTKAGTYLAGLLVTDDSGLSSTRSVPIVVTPQLTPMFVDNIVMSLKFVKGIKTASADINIRSAAGPFVSNALVTGTWSGAASGTSTIMTSSGTATFTSPSVKGRGAFIFTVTDVTLLGYNYQSNLNVITSNSISRR